MCEAPFLVQSLEYRPVTTFVLMVHHGDVSSINPTKTRYTLVSVQLLLIRPCAMSLSSFFRLISGHERLGGPRRVYEE